MKTASLYDNLEYNDSRPVVTKILQSDFTKELRICFLKGQHLKEHQTKFPIVIELVRGEINFGISGSILNLVEGDLISLKGGVPHDLTALEDSIVRLSLSLADHAGRVTDLAESSF